MLSGAMEAKYRERETRRVRNCVPERRVRGVAGGRFTRQTIGQPRRAGAAHHAGRLGGSGPCQARVQAAVDRQCGTTPAAGELEASAGADQAGGHIHQLLHDGAQAPPLGLAPPGRIGAEQSALAVYLLLA